MDKELSKKVMVTLGIGDRPRNLIVYQDSDNSSPITIVYATADSETVLKHIGFRRSQPTNLLIGYDDYFATVQIPVTTELYEKFLTETEDTTAHGFNLWVAAESGKPSVDVTYYVKPEK